MHACVLSCFSHVWHGATLWTVAHQATLSMGFSRQEYLSGLPCPPPGDLPDPGIKLVSLMSPALAGGFFITSATWQAIVHQFQFQFSRSVVSDSLWPHELQHTRSPCPSPTSGVYPNSCPLSRWCHPTISSAVVPFSCLQFSQHQVLFKWGSSSHQVAKVLELQLQHQSFQWIFRTDWFPLGWIGWISLQSKGCSRVFSNITVQKHQFFASIHDHW